MLRRFLILSILLPVAAMAQQPSGADHAASQMSDYATQREAALAPGNAAMRSKNYAEALSDFRRVVEEYPKDARVLLYAGDGAWAAGELQEAAGYYRESIACNSRYTWGVRTSLLMVDAAMGDWNDFQDQLRPLEELILVNPQLKEANKDGFIVERLIIGHQYVEVIDYPDPARGNREKFRFRLGGRPATDDVFVPHIDAKVDPGDPRHMVLEQFTSPQEHAIVGSYAIAESSYENLHNDVLRLLTRQLGATKVIHPGPFANIGQLTREAQ